jgi:hypothetical protein
MGNSFVKIPHDGCNVGKIAKLWRGYVQFVSLEYMSWVCLGMFGVCWELGAVLDKEICELKGNLQKAVVAHERKLRMIWSQTKCLRNDLILCIQQHLCTLNQLLHDICKCDKWISVGKLYLGWLMRCPPFFSTTDIQILAALWVGHPQKSGLRKAGIIHSYT